MAVLTGVSTVATCYSVRAHVYPGWYATDHRNGGRVRHLLAVRPDRESDPDVHPGCPRLCGGGRAPAGQADPVGLRGRIAAARRSRVRPQPLLGTAAGGRRRRGRRRQHDPDQRCPALRRPCASRVLRARMHRSDGCGDLGQSGGAGDGGGRTSCRQRPRGCEAAALQEQHRQQGRLLRVARELPDEPPDPVLGSDRRADAVPGVPAGGDRLGSGGDRAVGGRTGLPALPACRLHRGRGRPGDHAQTRHHQHPRRTARGCRQIPAAARHHR